MGGSGEDVGKEVGGVGVGVEGGGFAEDGGEAVSHDLEGGGRGGGAGEAVFERGLGEWWGGRAAGWVEDAGFKESPVGGLATLNKVTLALVH